MTDWRVRIIHLVALLLTATTWLPLLVGHRWFLLTGIICVLTAAAAQVADRILGRRLGTRWFGPFAALAVGIPVLGALLVPGGGWPGPSSLGELGRLLGAGGRAINSTVSPVTPTPQVQAVVVTALVVLWWVGDVIVSALRHPAGAALTLLAVYCVPSTILFSGVPVQWFILSLLGLLALLLVGNRERLSSWGRRLDAPERSVGVGRLGRGAVAAAVSLVLALFVPPLVPGLRGGLMAELRSGDKQGPSNALSTDLDLRRDLNRRTDRPLVRYTTTAAEPGPLRMFTVASLDNETWHLDTSPVDRVSPPPMSQGPADRSLDLPLVTTRLRRFNATTVGLQQEYLPFPGQLEGFSANRGLWFYDPLRDLLQGDQPSTPDLNFQALFKEALPKEAALSRRTTPAADGSVPAKYLTTRQNSSMLRERARTVTGNGTDYMKAQRLQTWFRSGGRFTYTTDITGATSRAAIDTFLTDRRGYCVHFATAMTLMARELGIPARVAIGLLPGQQEGIEWVASEQDAHAWPELYFSGVGWIRFEPTPAVRTGAAPDWTVRGTSSTVTPTASPTPTRATTPTVTATPSDTTEATASASPAQGSGQGSGQPSSLPKVLGLLAAAAGLVALLALPRLAAALVRRRRRRVAADPAEAAWAELVERLADLGVRPGPHLTPRAAGDLVGSHLVSDRGRAALGRRVSALELSRYAPAGRGGAGDPQEDVESIVRDVSGQCGLRQRLVASWLPRAVFRR